VNASSTAPLTNPILIVRIYVYILTATQGSDKAKWNDYDATELVKASSAASLTNPILIDIGDADSFLTAGQLLPEVHHPPPPDTRTPPSLDCVYVCVSICMSADMCWGGYD